MRVWQLVEKLRQIAIDHGDVEVWIEGSDMDYAIRGAKYDNETPGGAGVVLDSEEFYHDA